MPKSASQKKVGDQEVQMDRRRASRRTNEGAAVATKAAVKPKSKSVAQQNLAQEVQSKAEVPSKIEAEPKVEVQSRRKQQRRRQIDPTTCEREYTEQEIQFMHALDAYKRSAGRMFPTCSEILEVIRNLGYVQLTEDERAILKSIEEVEANLAELELSPVN